MERFLRTKTVVMWFTNYPEGSRSPVACDSGYPKIYIWTPLQNMASDTATVDGTAMTSVETGVYQYKYDLASDAARGWWNVKMVGDTSSDTAPKVYGFEVI